MTRSGRSSRGGSRPDPSAFDGHFFDVATLCECCGQADPPSPAALLAQEATARRLADALPPPTPRGEAALELLEAFPGDKKATVTDMASGRLYIADLTPGVPAPYRELFVRVLSKALRPGGAGSVVLRQFTGERVEGGPKNIYGCVLRGRECCVGGARRRFFCSVVSIPMRCRAASSSPATPRATASSA